MVAQATSGQCRILSLDSKLELMFNRGRPPALPRTSSNCEVFMHHKLNQSLHLLMAAVLALPVSALQQRALEKKDRIRILSIEPSTPVVRGGQTEIAVEIAYALETADESTVNIGFNSQEPKNFRMSEHIEIHRGTDRLKVKLKIIPIDWR